MIFFRHIMKKIKIFIFSISIFFTQYLFGQASIKTKFLTTFNESPLTGSIISTKIQSSLTSFEGNFNSEKYLLKKYIIQDIKKGQLYLNNKILVGNEINFLIEKKSDSSLIYYCDLSNDLDFTDEFPIYNNEVVYFNFSTINKSEYKCFFKLLNKSSYVYNNEKEEKFYLVLKNETQFKIPISSNFNIYAQSGPPFQVLNNRDVSFAFLNAGILKNFDLKEPIIINIETLIIDSIDIANQEIYYRLFNANNLVKLDGFYKNMYPPDLEFFTLSNNLFKFPRDNSKKYLLIDFWGTWCGPCKELTPKLKMMYQTQNQKLDILGVAFDEDLIAVKKYILEEKINWNQIIENKSINKSNLVQKFNITIYPTFILLNNKGKIIFRNYGGDGLNEINDFLIAN